MTQNNLIFFNGECDKKEIISNTKVANAGGTPTVLFNILPNTTATNTSKLFNYGIEIDKSDMLKAESYDELINKINHRLNRKYKPTKVKWVWQIQDAWKNSPLEVVKGNSVVNYRKLFNMLKQTIEGKAKGLANRYRSVRLSFHDFESELWDITYRAIEYYEMAGDLETEFTIWETLEMFWGNRIKSFIRSCIYTQKHNPWYTAAEVNEFYPDSSASPEEEYIRKETLAEIFNDSDLTYKERQLLNVISEIPDGSLREWGKGVSIKHPESVKRLLVSLQEKLSKYR